MKPQIPTKAHKIYRVFVSQGSWLPPHLSASSTMLPWASCCLLDIWGQAQAKQPHAWLNSRNLGLMSNATSSRDHRTLPHRVPYLFLDCSSWYFQPHMIIIYFVFIALSPTESKLYSGHRVSDFSLFLIPYLVPCP